MSPAQQQYQAYLQSDDWKSKKLLKQSRRQKRCTICASKTRIELHKARKAKKTVFSQSMLQDKIKSWKKRMAEYEKDERRIRAGGFDHDSCRYQGIVTGTRWCIEDLEMMVHEQKQTEKAEA